MGHMITAREAWLQEEKYRKTINPKNLCNFGIKSLDDALISFLPNDLIVLGADSGSGKSHLCLDIALHNANMGKKVGLYFIEGSDHEAISRIKWRMIKDNYFASGRNDMYLDYRKWRINALNTDKFEEESYNQIMDNMLDNLQMYRTSETFTLEEFKKSLGYFIKPEQGFEEDPFSHKHEVDLLIIDHIQYFTLTNSKNEYSEMTEIIKAVKAITDFHQIPVLIVSHLRKKEKDRGLPNQDDFFGTSNIAKICSEAITISPCYTGTNHHDGLYPTFFRFVKSRSGLKPNYAILNNFNFKRGTYEKDYQLIHLKGDAPGDLFKPFELPKWAYDSNLENRKGYEE